MVSERNMNLAVARLKELRATIPDRELETEKAFYIFQQLHIYRLLTIDDSYFTKEDPTYRTMTNDLLATSAVYVSPIWSLNNNDSFKHFKTYLVDKCKDKQMDINKTIGIIPGLITGIFSPKDSKLVNTDTMIKLSGVELIFCHKMTAKVKNNLIAI